jgi:hypothetical protein
VRNSQLTILQLVILQMDSMTILTAHRLNNFTLVNNLSFNYLENIGCNGSVGSSHAHQPCTTVNSLISHFQTNNLSVPFHYNFLLDSSLTIEEEAFVAVPDGSESCDGYLMFSRCEKLAEIGIKEVNP